jgi:hypothetical protein
MLKFLKLLQSGKSYLPSMYLYEPGYIIQKIKILETERIKPFILFCA